MEAAAVLLLLRERPILPCITAKSGVVVLLLLLMLTMASYPFP